ncbi:MAG TPA: nucleoside-diphosphate sugar epimerase/dehydratase [Vicinamibacterales bacterium]|nr:nucleoside-diphosphate sugar epimerase/dehydratase [Vicinamibacterales bacterium]
MVEGRSRLTLLIRRWHRQLSIVVQLGIVLVSNQLAFLLRFDGDLPHWASEAFWMTIPWLVAIRALTFIPFRLFEGLWRYTSLYDLRAIAGGISVSSALFFLFIQTPLGPTVYPRSIFIIDALLLMLLLGGVRMSRRVASELSHGTPEKRILVFGAGDAGELIVRDMKTNSWYGLQPIGFIDDDQEKVGHRIHGVPVLGTRADLPRIIARHRPHEVLLAIPRADPLTVRAIVRSLEPFRLPIKTLPNLRDLIDGKTELSQIRSLAVEDLLARAPVGLDPAPVKTLIGGRRVLVTGAGGSIGAELCRQIARLKPAALVMLERYENSLHAIRLELEDAGRQFGLSPVVGDVTDATRVAEVMRQHQPEIVFHAAAHKHVPLMEENPCEAIKNNVRGTRVLVQAAEAAGVDRFILISTDKAVNPTSVMGASKRLAELVVQHAQRNGGGTSFAVVRFGNVLASNGSVVPRFLEQIRRGGPVTITHPEMRRFFMLIPEAVQLVLHAAAQAQTGATYVLEMGEQVRLLDMARDLIRLSGFVPDEEIAIEFIGLRPGEKLYEELVGSDEEVGPSAIEKVRQVTGRTPPDPHLMAAVTQLEADAALGRRDAVLGALRSLTGMASPEERAGDAAVEPAVDAVVEPADSAVVPAVLPAPAVAAPLAPAVAYAGPAAAPVSPAAAAMAEPPGHVEQPCPQCHSRRLHRSRSRTLSERIRRSFSSLRLYRCDECNWRGWMIPLEFGDAGAIEPTAAPDMSLLDNALQGVQMPMRRSFSPRDLQ